MAFKLRLRTRKVLVQGQPGKEGQSQNPGLMSCLLLSVPWGPVLLPRRELLSSQPAQGTVVRVPEDLLIGEPMSHHVLCRPTPAPLGRTQSNSWYLRSTC